MPTLISSSRADLKSCTPNLSMTPQNRNPAKYTLVTLLRCVSGNRCEPTWTEHCDTNVTNGVLNNTSTLDGCQTACVDNTSCSGVDWKLSNSPGQRCYLHGHWSGGRNNGTAPGVTHYDLARCGMKSY